MNPSASLQWLMGPLFVLGDSYTDSVGNFSYKQSGVVTPNEFTNGPTAPMYLARICRQSGCFQGRYTPNGTNIDPSIPGLLWGRNYALGGSGINFNTNGSTSQYPALIQQITQLIADYPTPPANSVVWLALTGINDFGAQVTTVGGAYTSNTTTVTGNQTIPSQGSTMSVVVGNSAGFVIGSGSNQVTFITNAGAISVVITGTPDGTHINFVNPLSIWAGLVIQNGSIVVTTAQANMVTELTALQTSMSSLLSSGWTNVVGMVPFNGGYMPTWGASAALATATSQVYSTQYQSMITPFSSKTVRLLDMQPYYSDLIASPTKYGFKDGTSAWNSSGTTSPNDYVWWDSLHQTYASYKSLVWNSYLSKFHAWGFIEYVN